MGFFKRHEVFRVEWVDGEVYHRHFTTEHGTNYFSLRNIAKDNRLELTLKVASLLDLRPTIEKIRQQFDLGHNPHFIEHE